VSAGITVLVNPQKHDDHMEDFRMIGSIRFPRSVLAAVAVSTLGLLAIGTQPAAAVVVCKTAGVPQGCVAAAPVAGAAVVATPAVRVVRPRVYGVGRVGNRGGPVNRVGRL
jgi:hypothetical protein